MNFTLPPLPPLEMVLEISLHALLLPFVVAAVVVVMCTRWLPPLGRWAGGALALAAAFGAGNYFRGAVQFRIDHERPLAWDELARSAWSALAITPAGADVPIPPARYWLPWVVALGFAAELLVNARFVPRIIKWIVRGLAVVVATRLLVPPELNGEIPWLWPALAATCLVDWWLLDTSGAEAPPGWMALGLAGVSLAAATVLIHAHTARFTDVATILSGTWLGIAGAAYWTKSQPGGAIPAFAIGLPGLMLVGEQSTFSEVPSAAFSLIALAPIPLLFVRKWPKMTWRFAFAGWMLLLAPAAVGVALALWNEALEF